MKKKVLKISFQGALGSYSHQASTKFFKDPIVVPCESFEEAIETVRKGRADYTEIFEVAPANTYVANTGGILDDDVLRTVPIYDRNINASLTIKSTHPAPATLHNVTWEGVLNNNFYTRV